MPRYPKHAEILLSRVKVGRWGKDLAIRVPLDIAKQTGLADGDPVEIEAQDGDIVIRRLSSRARKSAVIAAEEIISESRRHRLDQATILQLVADGRRQ